MPPYTPVSPPPEVGPRGRALPAYLSNGLVGLRLREDPTRSGMCIVNGFVGAHHERKVEGAVAAPYPLGIDVALDDLWASDQSQSVESLDQTLDFETGELTTRVRLHIGEQTAVLEAVAFASRTHPSIVCQEVRVTPESACRIRLRARIDVAGVRGRLAERRTDTPGEAQPAADGSILWESEEALGRCGLALSTEGPGSAERTQEPWDALGPLSTTYALTARAGRPAILRQIVSLVPDLMHSQPQRQAVRLVADAAELGFDALRVANRQAWAHLWRSRIRLVGAGDRWQGIADAAFFYLNSSVHRASPAATSIYGLATWRDYHYYFGHVMWDVDAFATPPLSLLQPEAARALLDFRSRTRDGARRNAQMQGRLGLQYPWEASPRLGEEASPGGAGAAAREIHVSLHIARAFALWADASGDRRFLEEEAWPVLAGVADWICDRTERSPDGYHFRRLGGPAENPGFIDDDALTLMASRVVLKRAVEAANQLGKAASASWDRVADGLVLPLRADGVIAAHSDYRKGEPKGATPSPLMGLFPYWADVDDDTARRTLDFYLAQWPDYVGSPMLAALYGAWAAWTGDRVLSLKLFQEGYAAYLYPRFAQTLEYRLDKIEGVASGPFFANIGGFVTALLFGLPGLRIDAGDPAAWAKRPVVLPEGWTAIECDRLMIRGRPYRLSAVHGSARAELVPTD